MTNFVLDNSVAMRWLLASNKVTDQNYSESVLKSLADSDAYVPNLWHLEAANVLLSAEKRGELTAGELERFLLQLEALPILTDSITYLQAFNHTISLAKNYKLSSYDASYLELAMREGLPLATLDKDLIKAAKKAEIEIYLKK